MVSIVHSAAQYGASCMRVSIEVDVSSRGLPGIAIVGLQGSATRPLRERIKAAIRNTQIRLPARKVTINVRPFHKTNSPTTYDLPIALAVLSAFQMIPQIPANVLCFGELSLEGRVLPTLGCLTCLYDNTVKDSILFLPSMDIPPYNDHSHIVFVRSLQHAIELLKQPQSSWSFVQKKTAPLSPSPYPDISQIFGQASIKRALTIAATGKHHILLTGVPGVGKTLLAHAFPGLFPPLEQTEIIEVLRMYASANQTEFLHLPHPPFRHPVHTTTTRQLLGTAQPFSPGEISLAHNGILFLDELHQWKTKVLEGLRIPMEERCVHLPSENGGITLPAHCVILASTNPCPCGYYGSEKRACTCTVNQRVAYRQRLSGPFLDRFDMQIFVPEISSVDIHADKTEESPTIRKTVSLARTRQQEQKTYLPFSKEAKHLAEKALDLGNITPRGYFSVIRVAQTIADLDDDQEITTQHIAEALQYRTPIKS